jgi:hypothetical protein
VARPRKFTEAQWAEAMRLYVTDGPTAAAVRTGIDKGNLTRRAKTLGLTTVVIASTREATEAVAARRLVELRDGWLHPPGLGGDELEPQTLTNLYNERPTWLANAHGALDRAVLDAYGWPALDDEAILGRLLALNLGRLHA